MIVALPKSKFILISFIICSILTLLSLVLIIWVLPDVIVNEVYKNVRLTKGTEQYENFVETPFPAIFKVYFFNVENQLEVAEGKKPILKEVGPYIYKQYRRKSITSANSEDDTISYIQKESFKFDYEASGTLSDENFVTVLNIPLMSILQTAEDYNQTGLLSKCLPEIFPGSDSVFITAKVKDILFDGIGFCPRHLSFCEITSTVVCAMASKKRNVDVFDDGSLKFSAFNYKTKNSGVFTVKRGIKDIHTLGQIVALNNLKYTKIWERYGPNSTCDEVKGTDATLYPPQIQDNYLFQVYSTDICRYIEASFVQEELYKNIRGFKFAIENSTLRSTENNANDDCFCAKQTKGVDGNDACFLDGVVDMQPCLGAPVLLSFPHFLGADKSYVRGVTGLMPNQKLHSSYLLIEPATGIPLQEAVRIQLNAVLRPINRITQTKNLPRVVLPLFWVEEGFSLPDEYIDKLEESYFRKVRIVDISKWTVLSVSAALTLGFGLCLLRKKKM